MGFEDSFRWLRGQYKERQSNNYRGYMIRWRNNKVWKNLDAMFAYKQIYENLGTAGLPLLQGSQGKRKQSKAEAIKHGLMLTSGVFFFCFTKLGLFNKIFFCLITSQALVFVHKCNFYQGIIDDLASSMTLTGQEARIQVRYTLPDHPQTELYTQLCVEYLNLSAQQLEKHRKQVDFVAKAKDREQKLDSDFTQRLAALDEDDSVSQELPRNKKVPNQ